MAVPKKKTSKMKKRQRRTHHALSASNVGSCNNCGEPALSHQVCGKCGHYRGRQVIARGEEA